MPEVLSAIVTGLIQAVSKIWEFIPVMYTTVIDAIKSQDWAQMGKDIIDGLVKGVKNAAAKVGTALKEVANGAINSVKKVLGIRSPSKVFAGIGENMGLGLAEGFVGIMGQVSRSIANAVPKSIDAPLIRTAASMHTITQPLASVSAPTTVQLIANERVLGEVVLPTVSRGLATQRMNLALARGAV
jgi:phage-related protein